MIGSFSSSVDIAVGIYVSKTFLGSFKSLTIMMMSSGLWNSSRMYCFSFSLNLMYLSVASLCLAVVPKTTQNRLIIS